MIGKFKPQKYEQYKWSEVNCAELPEMGKKEEKGTANAISGTGVYDNVSDAFVM